MNFDGLTLSTAFSRNGEPTITTKDPSVTFFGNGNHGETSDSDIAQIRASYCGNATPSPPTIRRSTIAPVLGNKTMIKLTDVNSFY